MNTLLHTLAISAAMVSATLASQPQEPAPPPAQGEGAPEQGGERPARRALTPEAAREILEREEEQLREQRERLEEAKAALARGDAPGEALRPIWRSQWGERRAGGAGDRPLRRPPGENDRGGEPRPEYTGPASPEEREALLAMLREHLPLVAEKIEEIRAADPAAADRAFNRMLPKLREAAEVKRRDPKLFELRITEFRAGFMVLDAIRSMRESVRGGNDAAIAEARTALRQNLLAQFEARLALQQHEVEMLTARLEDLKADIARQQAGGPEHVDRVLGDIEERVRSNRRLPMEGGPDGAERDGRRPMRGPRAEERPAEGR